MDKEENTMKDNFDILFSREESDIEKIANNYPAAGQREKEKIYEICKRKYNIQKSEEKESESDGFIKQAEGVEVYKRPKLYRFLSVAAAVAIVAGGVGGYTLMRNKHLNDFGTNTTDPVQTEPDVEPTTAEAEDEFAELELHEMKIYHSREESEKAFEEFKNAWKNHTYEFKKVDVEKYADQILSAANADELNTLENKSYLYHICANVFHYYDTAEVKFVIDGEQQALNYHEEYERVLDNKQLYFYNKITSRSDNENEKVSVYVQDGNEGVYYYPTDKTYEKTTYQDDYTDLAGAYIPDNYRVAYCDDYEYAGVQKAWEIGNTFGELSNLDSFTLLSDFDQWHIEGVENILGRDCAHVNLVYNDGFNENTVDRWIDIRTGLVLKSSTKSDVLSQTTEVTELKLNEPVEKVDYDLTGYTFVENERGGF